MQRTIALSFTEAEYMALSDCLHQAMWLSTLLGEIGYDIHHIPICSDNQGSAFMAANPITERQSKHIDIQYHFICEKVEDGTVDVFYIAGTENPADMFTKPLRKVKFLKFHKQLGLDFTLPYTLD